MFVTASVYVVAQLYAAAAAAVAAANTAGNARANCRRAASAGHPDMMPAADPCWTPLSIYGITSAAVSRISMGR